MIRKNGNGESAFVQPVQMTYQVTVGETALTPVLQFTTHFDAAGDRHYLDDILDRLRLASERQKKLGDIAKALTDVANNEQQIIKLNEEIVRFDHEHDARAKIHAESGARTELELSAPKLERRMGMVNGIENYRFAISQAKARIAALEAQCQLDSQPKT